jgi:hypothetical protein
MPIHIFRFASQGLLSRLTGGDTAGLTDLLNEGWQLVICFIVQ